MGQEANVSPIRKVVMLIEEMKVQTEKDAEATIEELTAFVEESKAKEGQLKTEIGQLQTDIAEDTGDEKKPGTPRTPGTPATLLSLDASADEGEEEEGDRTLSLPPEVVRMRSDLLFGGESLPCR